jgi:hypothetical protein
VPLPLLRRARSSTAPIVVGGRTVTMHASTWSLSLRVGDTDLLFVHAQPDHVEVLEGDGRHHTVRVHDVTLAARAAISLASMAAIAITRRPRPDRRSSP